MRKKKRHIQLESDCMKKNPDSSCLDVRVSYCAMQADDTMELPISFWDSEMMSDAFIPAVELIK